MGGFITIFDKYIFKQVFQSTLVCLLLFIIVWIAPETLVRVIREIFIDHITLLAACKSLAYEIPKVLSKALPVGVLLGSIFTFDKLSKDNELSILRGVGISFNRIMVPVLVLGAALSILCFVVMDKMIPAVSNKVDAYFYNSHFVYIQKDKQNLPKTAVIVSNFTPRGIENLIVLNFSNEKYDDAMTFKNIIFSSFAKVGKDSWILPEAKQYIINKEGVYTKINQLKNYEVLKGQDSKDVYLLMENGVKKERAFSTSSMRKYINLLKKQDFTDEYQLMLSKYYQRFLHPLTCIVFAALGCLLGFSPPRSQRLVGFTVAVGLIFAYYITLPFFDLMAQKGVILPFIAAAFPMFSFLATIFIIKKVKDL